MNKKLLFILPFILMASCICVHASEKGTPNRDARMQAIEDMRKKIENGNDGSASDPSLREGLSEPPSQSDADTQSDINAEQPSGMSSESWSDFMDYLNSQKDESSENQQPLQNYIQEPVYAPDTQPEQQNPVAPEDPSSYPTGLDNLFDDPVEETPAVIGWNLSLNPSASYTLKMDSGMNRFEAYSTTGAPTPAIRFISPSGSTYASPNDAGVSSSSKRYTVRNGGPIINHPDITYSVIYLENPDPEGTWTVDITVSEPNSVFILKKTGVPENWSVVTAERKLKSLGGFVADGQNPSINTYTATDLLDITSPDSETENPVTQSSEAPQEYIPEEKEENPAVKLLLFGGIGFVVLIGVITILTVIGNKKRKEREERLRKERIRRENMKLKAKKKKDNDSLSEMNEVFNREYAAFEKTYNTPEPTPVYAPPAPDVNAQPVNPGARPADTLPGKRQMAAEAPGLKNPADTTIPAGRTDNVPVPMPKFAPEPVQTVQKPKFSKPAKPVFNKNSSGHDSFF